MKTKLLECCFGRVAPRGGETRYGFRFKSEGSNCGLRLREAVREFLIRRSVATSSRRGGISLTGLVRLGIS